MTAFHATRLGDWPEWGHKERLPPSRLSGRCGFGQRTFAATSGNDKGAPISAIRRPSRKPLS